MQHLNVRGAPHYSIPINWLKVTFTTRLLCLHLFSHLFAITFLLPLSSPKPHLPFPSFLLPSLSPIHYYPHTFIWYSCSPPPIIPSVFLPLSLSSPSQQCSQYWCLWWGMGGPVLPADFNEFLWGLDQLHQRRHSDGQFMFNVSLLTAVFSLHVMKAPVAGRMTRENSSKHCDLLSDGRGLQRTREISHEGGLISLPISHLCSIEE